MLTAMVTASWQGGPEKPYLICESGCGVKRCRLWDRREPQHTLYASAYSVMLLDTDPRKTVLGLGNSVSSGAGAAAGSSKSRCTSGVNRQVWVRFSGTIYKLFKLGMSS